MFRPILICLFLFFTPQFLSADIASDIRSAHASLIAAEEKGNPSLIYRNSRELIKACSGKNLLQIFPEDKDIFLRLDFQRIIGADHSQQGRHSQGIELLSPLVEKYSDSDAAEKAIAQKALLPLARSYSELSQIDKSILLLKNATKSLATGSPEIREAWLLLGDLYAAKGETLSAKRSWSRLTDDLNKYGDDARSRRNSSVRMALLDKPAFELGEATWFGGKKQSIRSMKGEVVLLDFWATWCGPCRMLMPGLDRLQKKYADKGLKVLGVTKPYAQGWLPDKDSNTRGQTVKGMTRDAFLQHVLEFRRRFGVSYPFVVTGKREFDNYRVGGIPMVVLIDKTGKIAWVRVGSGGEGLLDSTLERLLNEK